MSDSRTENGKASLRGLVYLVLGFAVPYALALLGWYLILRDWTVIPLASVRVAVTMCVLMPLGSYVILFGTSRLLKAMHGPGSPNGDAASIDKGK